MAYLAFCPRAGPPLARIAGLGGRDTSIFCGGISVSRPRVDDAMLALEDGGQFLELSFERLAREDVDARAAAVARPAVEHVTRGCAPLR